MGPRYHSVLFSANFPWKYVLNVNIYTWAFSRITINSNWEVMLNNYVHYDFPFSTSAASLNTGLDSSSRILLGTVAKLLPVFS